MEIKGEFNRKGFGLESIDFKYFYSIDGLSFESIISLVSNDKAGNTGVLKATSYDGNGISNFLNLKAIDFDKLEEYLSRKISEGADQTLLRDKNLDDGQISPNDIQILAIVHGMTNKATDQKLEMPLEVVREVDVKSLDKIAKQHYDVDKGADLKYITGAYANLDDSQEASPADTLKDVLFVNEAGLTQADPPVDTTYNYPKSKDLLGLDRINPQLAQSNVQTKGLKGEGLEVYSLRYFNPVSFEAPTKSAEQKQVGNSNKTEPAKDNANSLVDDTFNLGSHTNEVELGDATKDRFMFDRRNIERESFLDGGFEIKVEKGAEYKLVKDEFESIPIQEHKGKREEPWDVYVSELPNPTFMEEVETAQEVKNAKHIPNIQEHRFFHVKLEDADLKIKVLRDTLNIKLDLKEDLRLPSPQETYRLIESLSQMGLRVEFFGISGKNLQWEFRQGQENKRESGLKDLNIPSDKEKEAFSLYL